MPPLRQTGPELTTLARMADLGFQAHSTVSDIFTLRVLETWTQVLVLVWLSPALTRPSSQLWEDGFLLEKSLMLCWSPGSIAGNCS